MGPARAVPRSNGMRGAGTSTSAPARRGVASAPALPQVTKQPVYFYQGGNFVLARYEVKAPKPRRAEKWKRPPTPATHIPAAGEVGSLSSYRLRPSGQPSSSVAWDAPWGWDHGRLGGRGKLTSEDASRLQSLNTKRAHLRARPRTADGLEGLLRGMSGDIWRGLDEDIWADADLLGGKGATRRRRAMP